MTVDGNQPNSIGNAICMNVSECLFLPLRFNQYGAMQVCKTNIPAQSQVTCASNKDPTALQQPTRRQKCRLSISIIVNLLVLVGCHVSIFFGGCCVHQGMQIACRKFVAGDHLSNEEFRVPLGDQQWQPKRRLC